MSFYLIKFVYNMCQRPTGKVDTIIFYNKLNAPLYRVTSVGSSSLLSSTHRLSLLHENKGWAQGKSLTPNKNRDMVKCSKTNGCPAFTASSRAKLAEHSGEDNWALKSGVPFNFNGLNQTMKNTSDKLVLVTSVGILWVCHRQGYAAVSHLTPRHNSDRG